MDILKPDLVWVDNDTRCYRKTPVRNSQVKKSYEEEDSYPIISTNYEDDEEYNDLLIKYEKNIFWISISVPQELFKFVIGSKNKNRNMIETMTGASIVLPPKNVGGEIVIRGQSKNSVGSAYHRVKETANWGRFLGEFTHFVSVPISDKDIQESFLRFKEDILTTCKRVRGMSESIFQDPKKLHLTIATLVLLDNHDKQKAEALFQKCKNEIVTFLDGKKLEVQVKGIEYMNDDPAEVDVLYAKVKEIDDDNCLQIIADKLMTCFVENDLSKKEYDKVKLHITLINTRFRSSNEADENKRRINFDAKPILEKYENYDFGQMVISEIHISIRHSTGTGGYYMSSQKIILS